MTETVDWLVTGADVVLPGESEPVRAVVGVTGGKITHIEENRGSLRAVEELAAEGLVVLPGIIDPHVHAREPGTTEREDFASCTRGAAAGGVTTIIEMPVSIPPTSSVDALALKLEIASEKAHVDFGLYGGAGFQSLENVQALADAGVCAFKTFLGAPHPGREAEFEGLYVRDDADLLRTMEAVAATGRLHGFHAENSVITDLFEQRLRESGAVAPINYVAARPEFAEVQAIQKVLAFASYTRSRAHILHCSCRAGIDAVVAARSNGVEATIESCPHYLWFNERDIEHYGPYARIAPPIRTESENELLGQALRAGMIDTIGSDHGPHLCSAKERGHTNIFDAPAGSAGVETLLPIMLMGVVEGRWSLSALADAMSHRVAELYGLSHRKGGIALGRDADLVVVDLDRISRVDAQALQVHADKGGQLYHGRRVVGPPHITMVRGRVVYRNGEIVGPLGYGSFIPHRDAGRTQPLAADAHHQPL